MLNKYEKAVLESLTSQNTNPSTDKYPIYYSENGVLIREESDGSKYKIKLDENNNEQIIAKI